MAKLRLINDDDLCTFVSQATSWRDLMFRLGLRGGGSYHNVVERVEKLNCSIEHFTGRTWNKGLTANEHPAIKRLAETLSKNLTGKPGHAVSAATKEKLSLSRQQYLMSHPNNGVKWFEVECSLTHELIKVQGTWELQVANWLNKNNIEWSRKTLRFNKHRRYTPDFYLPSFDAYIEVKGFWRDRDIYKMYLVLDEHEIDLRVVDKTNINDLSFPLPKFVERFNRSEIDIAKFKNVWSDAGTGRQLSFRSLGEKSRMGSNPILTTIK